MHKQKCISLAIGHAAETDGGGAVFSGRHEQIFSVLAEFVSLREIPVRALWLIVTAAAQDAGARVRVAEFIGPLPDVARQVFDTERAGTSRMRVHIIGPAHNPSRFGRRDRCRIPLAAPRVQAAITSLGGVLPLPLVRQAIAGPTGIRAR